MENAPFSQLYEFIASVLWGGLTGILYGLFGIFRFGGNKWIIAVSDFVFWLITAVSTFVFFLAINGGNLRGFMLVGAVLGAVLIRICSRNLFYRLWLAFKKRCLKKGRKAHIKSIKASEKK